jgi:type IV pilus assembly protein PilC
MPIFTYKVKNQDGKIFTGESRIKNEAELVAILDGKGLSPIEIKEKNAYSDIREISFLKKKVKTKDLAVFCRQFAIVLEAGVPMATAMDVMRAQATNPTFKRALNDLYDDIQKGIQLSNSMKKHGDVFPEILMNMVEAGEISGQLDRVFTRMADHFEKEFKLNQKIKGALTYPIIVCCVAVGVIFIMMAKVVPSFAEILEGFGAEMPGFTKILISISSFFKAFWWLILGGIIGLVVSGKTFSKSKDGKHFFGALAIKLPILKAVTRNIITARLTRTLGTLMSSGVLLIQAMEVVQKILGNIVIAEKIEEVISEVKKGKGLTQPLTAMNYFPPMLISMVKIGEESGNLDYSLEKSADFYDQEVETSLQQLTALIEPLVIIVMALIVAFIILSILYPMMSIYQNMSD